MSSFRIGSPGAKLVLFQLAPGLETSAGLAITKHLSTAQSDGKVHKFSLWKLFGTYDLLAIYEVTDFDPLLLFAGSVGGIQKSNEIFAFPWVDSRTPAHATSFDHAALASKPVLGISFQKARAEEVQRTAKLSRSTHLTLDHHYMESILDQNDHGHVLSTFGWSEFVSLGSHNSIDESFHWLHNETIATRVSSKPGAAGVLTNAYSFVGIRFDLIRDRPLLRETLYQDFGKKGRLDQEAVVAQLRIKCMPDSVARLRPQLEARFRTDVIDVVLGRDDLIVDLSLSELGSWGEFVDNLLELREQTSGDVLATAVQIQAKVPERTLASVSATRRHSTQPIAGFPIDASDVDEVRRLKDPIARNVLGTIYTTNSLVCQELIRDCFVDLMPFVGDLVARIWNRKIAEYSPQALEKLLERFAFAADQRAMGALSDLETSEGRFSPFRGGVQRVLLAMDLIPIFVVKEVCKQPNWVGFTTIGFDRRFWHFGQTLNLPTSVTFSPEKWWGLSHESGHALVETRKRWFPLKALQAARSAEGRLLDHFEIDLLKEIFIDLFDYRYCFRRELDTYLRTIWEYLLQLIGEDDDHVANRLDAYVLRVFITYFLHHVPDGDPNLSVDSAAAIRMFDSFSERIAQATSGQMTVAELSQLKERVLLSFADLRFAFRHIVPAIEKDSERFQSINSPASVREAKATAALLRQGFVATEIGNPIATIHELRQGGPLEFSARVATVLSFWNAAVIRYGYVFRELGQLQ